MGGEREDLAKSQKKSGLLSAPGLWVTQLPWSMRVRHLNVWVHANLGLDLRFLKELGFCLRFANNLNFCYLFVSDAEYNEELNRAQMSPGKGISQPALRRGWKADAPS